MVVLSVTCAGIVLADGGRVTGSVHVDRATLRTEGPKHDLDVVLYLERIDGGLVAVERQLEEIGAPWTPNRFPRWTAE